jgi:hypothetical protein
MSTQCFGFGSHKRKNSSILDLNSPIGRFEVDISDLEHVKSINQYLFFLFKGFGSQSIFINLDIPVIVELLFFSPSSIFNSNFEEIRV